MLSKIQIARLIFKAYEINAENSRFKLCVEYSKCCGDHHVEFYVIDESVPYDATGSRVVVNITVDDKFTSMSKADRIICAASDVEGTLAEMENWRESNGAKRAV